MEWMTRSDIVLLAIASYVAVMTLVRMMRRRHDELVADVQRQIHARRRGHKRHDDDSETRGAA